MTPIHHVLIMAGLVLGSLLACWRLRGRRRLRDMALATFGWFVLAALALPAFVVLCDVPFGMPVGELFVPIACAACHSLFVPDPKRRRTGIGVLFVAALVLLGSYGQLNQSGVWLGNPYWNVVHKRGITLEPECTRL